VLCFSVGSKDPAPVLGLFSQMLDGQLEAIRVEQFMENVIGLTRAFAEVGAEFYAAVVLMYVLFYVLLHSSIAFSDLSDFSVLCQTMSNLFV
jgi:hypothetical protein